MAFIDKDTDVKPEMNMAVADTGKDDKLDLLVLAVLSLWDELTDRTWASTTQTEYYSSDGNTKEIYLKNYPVVSITTIHDDPDWEWNSDDLIASTDYTFDTNTGVVYLDGPFLKGRNSIRVIYVAGYSDDDVPDWLKQILVRQVCHWYKQGDRARWDLSSKNTPDGSTTAYKLLVDNLLPDFVMMAERKGFVGMANV